METLGSDTFIGTDNYIWIWIKPSEGVYISKGVVKL